MSNKRNLKKYIAVVCGDLAAQCIMAANLIKGVDIKKMNELVVKIAMLQDNAMRKVTVAFDKQPKDFESMKAYHKAHRAYYHAAYKSLNESFRKSVEEIISEMNAALPKKA